MRIIHKYYCDGLIVISKFLKKYYCNNNNIYVPPLIELSKYHDKTSKNSHEEFRLIYAGDLGDNKDNLILILSFLQKIISSLNVNLKLDIIGISKKQILKVKELKKKYDNFFVFHGRVENSIVKEIIKKSHYVIFFRNENIITKAGFPTKFVESMSCSTPF